MLGLVLSLATTVFAVNQFAVSGTTQTDRAAVVSGSECKMSKATSKTAKKATIPVSDETVGTNGESCCQPGATCCQSGSCCQSKKTTARL